MKGQNSLHNVYTSDLAMGTYAIGLVTLIFLIIFANCLWEEICHIAEMKSPKKWLTTYMARLYNHKTGLKFKEDVFEDKE